MVKNTSHPQESRKLMPSIPPPPPDIRWVQRLSNYQRARLRLSDAVTLAQSRPLSDLEKQGLIQAFEFVFELAWKVMKDYFLYQGNPHDGRRCP